MGLKEAFKGRAYRGGGNFWTRKGYGQGSYLKPEALFYKKEDEMKNETKKDTRFFLTAIAIAVLFFLSPVMSFAADTAEKKVNVNTATLEELVQVKGIGNQIAERIIEYRDKNGPFEQIEDLLKVKGIGDKKLESIRDFLVIE